MTDRPTTPSRRRVLTLAAGAAALPLLPRGAWAQAWTPSKPVVIVVPYPAGGATDVVARMVAQKLSVGLGGASVIVENMPGASGALGSRRVARAEPDGHTLCLSTNQTHATNISLLKDGGGYDPIKDFTPLGGLGDLQHVLVVRKDLPAKTVPELLDLARKTTSKLNCGSTGIGSASHLAMELFKVRTGLDFVHVPYRGAAPLLQDMVGGRIDLSFATVPTVLGQVQAGELRVLAVASGMASPHMPDAPTLATVGVAGVEADAWLAIFAPSATPAAITGRYAAILAEAMGQADLKAELMRQGVAPNWRDPARFAAFQKDDVARWADIIKTAKVVLEN